MNETGLGEVRFGLQGLGSFTCTLTRMHIHTHKHKKQRDSAEGDARACRGSMAGGEVWLRFCWGRVCA